MQPARVVAMAVGDNGKIELPQVDTLGLDIVRKDLPPSEANLADFSLLRLLPRKDRLRRGKGQGHHVSFGVINVISSASRALLLLPRFRTYCYVASLGDQIG
jgi:hypothetical protein